MEHARQWLRLMQLSSSSLPVGSFTWSQGLEWAVEAGWVTNADAFKRWQIQQMEQSFFCVDLPLFTVSARPAIGTNWRRPNAGRHTCSPAGKRASCAKKNATAERPLRV
jgi:urease accessory protein UreF